MDEIRELLQDALRDHWETPVELLVEDILQRLEPYLKGPKIPIKKLNDLAGWLQ